MSILVPAFPMLLLLGVLRVGGASTAHPAVSHAHQAGVLQPIGREQTRSICAALCIAGLGGEPCGAPCATLTPHNITQSDGGGAPAGTLATRGGKTRRDVCPLLCAYRLGEPLCGCGEQRAANRLGRLRAPRVDYHRVCGYFCTEHGYRIYGCPECAVYRMRDVDRRVRPTEMDIDWEQWCREQCAVGMGGVACDCELPLPLPMSIVVEKPHAAA